MDWRLDSYFSGIAGEDYRSFKARLEIDLNNLKSGFDGLKETMSVAKLAEGIVQFEELTARVAHLHSYVECLCSAQSDDESYLTEESWLGDFGTEKEKVNQVLIQLFRRLSVEEFEELLRYESVADLEYLLREWREVSQQSMSEEMEFLSADMDNCGSAAFSRLYFKWLSRLKFSYESVTDGLKTVPFSYYRSLLGAENPEERQAVFEGAQACLKSNRDLFGAALNSIAGTRLQLNKRRGGIDHLETALRQSRISKETFEAMNTAIRQNLPLTRAILKERMKTMGLSGASYWDLEASAPIKGVEQLSWETTVSLVEKAFSEAYPNFATYYRKLIDSRWIDFRPRESKRSGGYCTHSFLTKEARIFMTFNETMNDVMTLAHEAGHAWHSELLNDRRYFLGDYPMTLAESASTFAEMILSDGVIQSDAFSKAQKKLIIDTDASRVVSFLIEVPVRCAFEDQFYQERQKGEVSVERICEIMTMTQREFFGDSLRDGGEDPYFWASKLHFYIHETQFYNFPYTFGYLVSVYLINRLRESGKSFLKDYERYLSISAEGSVESVMSRSFGEDIRTVAFWDRTIQTLSRQLDLLKNG